VPDLDCQPDSLFISLVVRPKLKVVPKLNGERSQFGKIKPSKRPARIGCFAEALQFLKIVR